MGFSNSVVLADLEGEFFARICYHANLVILVDEIAWRKLSVHFLVAVQSDIPQLLEIRWEGWIFR